MYVIKALEVQGMEFVMVANADQRGLLEGWTFVPNTATGKPNYLNNRRWGQLLYGRQG